MPTGTQAQYHKSHGVQGEGRYVVDPLRTSSSCLPIECKKVSNNAGSIADDITVVEKRCVGRKARKITKIYS